MGLFGRSLKVSHPESESCLLAKFVDTQKELDSSSWCSFPLMSIPVSGKTIKINSLYKFITEKEANVVSGACNKGLEILDVNHPDSGNCGVYSAQRISSVRRMTVKL